MLFALVAALLLTTAPTLVALRTLHEAGRLPRPLAPLVEATGWVRPGYLLVAAALMLFLATGEPVAFMIVLSLAAAGLLLSYLRAWVAEFQFLMSLSDDDFPGRFDKPVWALTLVVLGPVGLWAFRRHRAACVKAAAEEEVGGEAHGGRVAAQPWF